MQHDTHCLCELLEEMNWAWLVERGQDSSYVPATQTHRHTCGLTKRQTDKHTDRQTDTLVDGQRDRQADRLTNKLTDKQVD